MSEQFLDGANVIALLQQVSGEAVTKGVAACGLGYPGLAAGFFEGLLQDGFVEVVPADHARAGIDRKLGGRQHKLPPPLLGCMGVFLFQRIG
jgi:hypothetical protein